VAGGRSGDCEGRTGTRGRGGEERRSGGGRALQREGLFLGSVANIGPGREVYGGYHFQPRNHSSPWNLKVKSLLHSISCNNVKR
jgi:hypothetical protein